MGGIGPVGLGGLSRLIRAALGGLSGLVIIARLGGLGLIVGASLRGLVGGGGEISAGLRLRGLAHFGDSLVRGSAEETLAVVLAREVEGDGGDGGRAVTALGDGADHEAGGDGARGAQLAGGGDRGAAGLSGDGLGWANGHGGVLVVTASGESDSSAGTVVKTSRVSLGRPDHGLTPRTRDTYRARVVATVAKDFILKEGWAVEKQKSD